MGNRSFSPVTILGEETQSGAYLLRIWVQTATHLSFGRFQGGRPIQVPAGTYAYVGSAQGMRGSAMLARRLIRHATRGGSEAPHAILAPLLAALRASGLGRIDLTPPAEKRLHWHIDFLLASPVAELSHILILRSARRLERELAVRLGTHAGAHILKKGLGASDSPGQTHLLTVPGEESWWADLVKELAAVIR